MIESLRLSQRGDVAAFSDGLRRWLDGEDSVEADAAGYDVAETLIVWRKRMLGKRQPRV